MTDAPFATAVDAGDARPPDGTEIPAEAPPTWTDAPLAPRSWRLGGLLLDGILAVCTVGVGWLAWWILTWDDGRSPAKVVLRMRVVRADTRALPGFGRMALRDGLGKGLAGGIGVAGLWLLGGGASVARYLVAASVAWLAMSIAAALLDADRRAIWDMFAGTVVVLDPEVAELPTRDDAVGPTTPDDVVSRTAEEGSAPS